MTVFKEYILYNGFEEIGFCMHFEQVLGDGL